jgi:hypothetical protein
MNTRLIVALSIAALALGIEPLSAQVNCARTIDNKCADQSVVNAAQSVAIQNSQQKISQTARPVAPTQDGNYTKPTDITRFENSQRGTGLTHVP